MKVAIIIAITVIIIIGSSSSAFSVVLVFLDKDIYEIPTPDNPLTIFIESPGKVIISVSNGAIATVLGETSSGEFTIYYDDYNFMEGTMLIANHINDYTLKEWTDVSTFSKNGSTESAKETTSVKTRNCDEFYLEVRCSNTDAVHLYEKLGFVIRQEINAYYRDGESAYLMAIELD